MQTACRLLLILHVISAAGAGSGSWWNIGLVSWNANPRLDQTLILSAQPTCTSIAGLSPKQTAYCQKHFPLMRAVTYGTRLGMAECRKKFESRRWNCASKRSAVAFGPAADDATKESSFAHAVSAAGVVHAISRACKRAAQEGEIGLSPLLQQCGCSKALRPRTLSRDWIWGGCGDDILFGYEFAKGFIDAKEVEQNHPRFSKELAKTMMNLHNNEVGRQAVFRSAEIGCKCHGVSGSCSLRTCWQQLRPFGQVGDRLLQMYDGAARVKLSRKGTDIRRLARRRPRRPRKTELVFIEASPDYCNPNPALGIEGTRNRECQLAADSLHPSSCAVLCCNRGYVTRRVRETRRCRCKFEWCCQVKCDICEEEREIHVCK